MDGVLATLLPQKEPGDDWPPDGGGVLAREGSPGLVVVAGTMVPWCHGAASALSGLTLASNQTVSNILAMPCCSRQYLILHIV